MLALTAGSASTSPTGCEQPGRATFLAIVVTMKAKNVRPAHCRSGITSHTHTALLSQIHASQWERGFLLNTVIRRAID